MKTAVIIFAIFGVAFGAQVPSFAPRSCDLSSDFAEFWALVPEQDIVAHVFSCLEDPHVQVVLAYLFTPEFHNYYKAFLAIPEVQTFAGLLRDGCLDIDRIDQAIRNFLGMSRRGVTADSRSCGGFNGILDHVISLLPIDELRALALHKLQTSPDFANLYEILRSDATLDLIARLREQPAYQHLVGLLHQIGFDVARAIEIIRIIFGVEY